MNSLELKVAFPDVSGKRIANVVELKEQPIASRVRGDVDDAYISANASDAVAAKVLSFSIGQRFDSALSSSVNSTTKTNKLQVIDNNSLFNIDKVVDNVLGFVTAALTELSKNGATSDDIIYFKQQAADGVNYGVEQAKAELAKVSSEKLSQNIEDSRAKILDGINKLPNSPMEYSNNKLNSLSDVMNTFSIKTNSGRPVDISFGPKAFLIEANEQGQKQLFTSQASNISFSLSGNLMNDEVIALADVVNRVDDLTTTFYRKDIEALYTKAKNIGYDDKDLLNLSLQNGASGKKSVTATYNDIQHLNDNSKLKDLSSPKAVAEYVSRLMSVMETSERELASLEDYNQVINGLVNQMKDVQVPDLLQAINRFHAFNSKFANIS